LERDIGCLANFIGPDLKGAGLAMATAGRDLRTAAIRSVTNVYTDCNPLYQSSASATRQNAQQMPLVMKSADGAEIDVSIGMCSLPAPANFTTACT
jgi:hypothetical protein